ncbi:hypothetical protein [Haloarcula nitratireducens]|uniref:Halobacterial output domain-containing protein n=1 Tax=Haloarcula nitratireducens TaxID=2487749 RepID=A0AAW4PK26_9EURY|nr:hypothetical protein [Halomicroarcula nitratireducens]MBX0297650.1 hypothetical protein [Halomicroarcula nitratireducens]
MTADEAPVHHGTLPEPTNLRDTLERAGIEHLDVDEERIVVIYQQAILMVTATDGQITATQELDIELWEAAPRSTAPDSDAVLTSFTDELAAATGTPQ